MEQVEKVKRLDKLLDNIIATNEDNGTPDSEAVNTFTRVLETIPNSEDVLRMFNEAFQKDEDDENNEFGDEMHESAPNRTQIELFVKFYKIFTLNIRYISEPVSATAGRTVQQLENQISGASGVVEPKTKPQAKP